MRFEFNDDSQKICNSADVVNYGIQCDICGNKVLSVSNINGKRYCAGCHCKTFIKDNQQTEIDQLKQQLDEKDKEIEKLKQQYTILENENGKLTTELIMGKYKKAQREVSFGKQLAIQELEKVKAWCEENSDDLDDAETDERVCLAIGLDRSIITGDMGLYDYIDQQIKELKGEKDAED